tara:strand:- start:102 stop:3527 length:3426 start_codon:yes stop_codon:yes gene_type:complete
MEIFEVEIAPGVTETVEAKNADEARKKVKAIIAQGAMSPFYDELFFDYETGVDNKKLRRNLSMAETTKEQNKVIQDIISGTQKSKEPIEQENFLLNEVGELGFTRNTKGQIALTPYGMKQLGLEKLIKTVTLTDGTTINQNTIIDENDFNLRTGDLSDLAGIAGPVIGAVIGLSPQARIVKGLAALTKRPVFARMFAAGSGSTAGKAVEEEVIETMEGFQLQDRDDINNLYKQEFVFGSLAQGLGEGVFKIYQTFLGKRAAPADSRIMFQQNRNRSVTDVMNLDRELGRQATENEIKAAIRKGKVKRFDWKMNKSTGAIPAQQSLERMLPGRTQSIAEQVLGNNRDKANASYLFAELNYLTRGIKDEKAALDSYISAAQKGRLDESVNQKLQNLRSKEAKVTQRLEKLLGEITDDALEVGNYGMVPSRRDFGETIKNTVSTARSFVTKEMGNEYKEVDNLMKDMRSIYQLELDDFGELQFVGRPGADVIGRIPTVDEFGVLKTDAQAVGVANTINASINQIANTYFEKSLLRIRSFMDDFPGYDLSIQDPNVKGGTIAAIQKKFQDLYNLTTPASTEKGLGISLFQLRNLVKDLDIYIKETPTPTPQRELLFDLKRYIDSYGRTEPKSIMTDLTKESLSDINTRLARQNITMTQEQKNIIQESLRLLRDTNKKNAERMQPFDNLNIQKIISNASKGAHPPDEIYERVFLGGSAKDLEDLFKATRNYDEYLESLGKEAVTEKRLKAQLKRRFFDDAIYKATDGETNRLNYTTFARQFLRFDRDLMDQGKIDVLFQNADGITTGPLVRQTIFNLNRIQPNLSPARLRDLVDDFTGTNRGLDASNQGKAFIRGLQQLANESEKVMKFRANRAISDLPEKGIEATTDTIFRPGNASVINTLKGTVDDDVFNSIQQASMMKLLKRSVDFNGKGKINDIFKPGNLETALNSYGDETLEAMFGKEITRGLRDFQKQVDVLTKGEVGRGGSAGGLVAAGLGAAVVFAPLQTLPALLGLTIVRTALGNPRFVGYLSKTDPGSIAQAIQILERAARQYGVRMVDGSFVSSTVDFADETFEAGKTALGITDEDVDTGVDEGLNLFQQLREQVTAPIRELPQLPQVDTTQASVDPLSPERLDFAERIAGRPVV